MVTEEELAIVICGFLIAFALSFGIGANDVANSFGTSVGSRVLTLKTACVLATISEISGAILLGNKVSKTIRSDLLNLTMFNETKKPVLNMMSGQISALSGSCIWLLIATLLKFPVSGTHSIIGATVGFTLVIFGGQGINWNVIYKIVASWFISPALSGIISSIFFLIIKKTVLEKAAPLEPALHTLPFLYGITVLINLFSILYNGLSVFRVESIPLYAVIIASLGGGLVTGLLVYFAVVPLQRKKIKKQLLLAEERRLAGYPENELFDVDESSVFDRIGKRVHVWFVTQRRVLYEKLSELCKRKKHNTLEDKVIESPRQQDSRKNSLRPKTLFESITPPLAQDEPEVKQDKFDNADTFILDSVANHRAKNETEHKAAVENGTVAIDMPSSSHSIIVTDKLVKDRPEEARVFAFAQILTAVFGAFAHGANDVSNAIGPLIGLWLVTKYRDVYTDEEPPVVLFLFGGMGIAMGLWIMGRRVIETIGQDLSVITPSSGVCIELGSAVTVLVASKVGIPISTTHCKVGSVVCVGYFRSRESVNWRLFMNIFICWVITLPISGALAAFVMWICMRHFA